MADQAEQDRIKALIAERAKTLYGIEVKPEEWGEDEDGIVANLGTWVALIDDDERGLYEGDEGQLHASVVGAPQHGNERVYFGFVPEGHDMSLGEVSPFVEIEPAR